MHLAPDHLPVLFWKHAKVFSRFVLSSMVSHGGSILSYFICRCTIDLLVVFWERTICRSIFGRVPCSCVVRAFSNKVLYPMSVSLVGSLNFSGRFVSPFTSNLGQALVVCSL